MYSEKDAMINGGQIRKEAVKILLCMLPFLAAAVAAFIVRLEPVCIAATIAAGSVMLFLWDLRLGPLFRYKAFLREIQSGLTRETVGALVRVSPDPVYQDGVYSHEMIINIYEDMSEEGERRFLLDCTKSFDEKMMGQDVVIISHGSYVLDMKPARV
ncbi:MAG: hypothetical protein IKU34_03010 [Clostridia bacterium]|nr:hypothetical protein [Clostridia bacterium]